MSASGEDRDVAVLERTAVGRWTVERRRGPAGALHALDWPVPLVPTVWLLEVDQPALVLGSTQPDSSVDRDRLADQGIELVRRRSGGGSVLLEPGGSVWIDVLVPRADERWDDDVSRSFHWLGAAWAAALGDLGVPADVHRGGLMSGRFGRLVCFAGIGPGEVIVGGGNAGGDRAGGGEAGGVQAGARKAVGLSQRRTRDGARFQSVVHRSWHPEPLGALDGVEPDELPPVATFGQSAAVIGAALIARLG